ncbi:RNA pseudouridine synthase [Pseudoduganella sp. OTU4001]|uniref:RNA pseudouridine synthase n=1 Tax=Pseudoduganella sp. OTU4001 TaxID=3043854 RepID=UPI00313D4950
MNNEDNTIRLAKRVAEMVPCSRREAEIYIEGAYVTVDGEVVEEPGARVAPHQHVVLAPDATLLEIAPVTILLNKPAGADPLACLSPDARSADAKRTRFLSRHVRNLTACLPLENEASGLFVFTQDFRVARKLVDEGALVEQELIVDVDGAIADNGLAQLNQGNGKVSWQNERRLRFAVRPPKPSLISKLCADVGLKATAIKRQRIGRISMAGLQPGEWRYLQGYERF